MTATYRFGRFELNPATRQVLVDKQPAPLGARAFDVLLTLMERRDRLVTKSELLDLVWPGVVVEENNLMVQISALRKLLGADAIATIAGRGYRFSLTLDQEGLSGALDPHEKPPVPFDEATPSIAVLPFVNMSGDEENEYFADGLAEELANVLAKIGGLSVAARTSSFQFKGRGEDIAAIGRKLNVATILEGSVRKAGNRVRITVQLVKVADGYHLWSQRYDRTLEDIFAIQDDIAQSVVKELRTTLLGEVADAKADEEAIAAVAVAVRGRSTNPEAHRLFSAGAAFHRSTHARGHDESHRLSQGSPGTGARVRACLGGARTGVQGVGGMGLGLAGGGLWARARARRTCARAAAGSGRGSRGDGVCSDVS